MVIQYKIKFEDDQLIFTQTVNPDPSDSGGTGTGANPDDGGSGSSASTDKGGAGTTASTDKGGTGTSASTDRGGMGFGNGRYVALILGTIVLANPSGVRTTSNGDSDGDLAKEPEVLGPQEVEAAKKAQAKARQRNARSKRS